MNNENNKGNTMFTEKQIEIINQQIEKSLLHYSYLFHLTVEDITNIYKNIDIIKLDFVAQKIKEAVSESVKSSLLDIKYEGDENIAYKKSNLSNEMYVDLLGTINTTRRGLEDDLKSLRSYEIAKLWSAIDELKRSNEQ
jgi:hypothetical protein